MKPGFQQSVAFWDESGESFGSVKSVRLVYIISTLDILVTDNIALPLVTLQ